MVGRQSIRAAVLAVSVLGLAGLGGCASITSAGPGAYAVGEAYSVTLGREWSDVSVMAPKRPSNLRVLSIDGPLLNLFYLAHDIEPGAGLIRPASRNETVPVYRADMTSREIVEFVTSSVEAWGYLNVTTEALLPADFGGRPGVAFDFSAQTEEGLNISGRAAAAARNEQLQVMVYLAPSEHYYARHQAEVDAIFASVVRVQTSAAPTVPPPAPPPPAAAPAAEPTPQPEPAPVS